MGRRSTGRHSGSLGAAFVLAALASACSVGNYNYREAAVELDGVLRIEGSPPDQRLVHLEHAQLLPWYLRCWPLLPLKPVLRWTFGGQPSPSDVENPTGHARDLLGVLDATVSDRLGESADATIRFAQVAELDASLVNRMTALLGLEHIASLQGIELLAGMMDAAAYPAPPEHEKDWIQALLELRPAVRVPADLVLTDAQRARYAAALAGLCARPLPQPSQRVALLRDLADALAGETDAALRTATAQAVRAAIAHCLRWTILRALQRSDAEYRTDRESLAEVRVCAIEIVQRTGGPDAVPFMLAWMAAPPERMRENAKRFDLDHYVRLRLIHLCGQLDLTRASKSIRLPGREAWEPASPIDYLCDTLLDVLTRTPFYTALRIPALEALCRCVGRPFDLDDSWVRGWYEEYRRRT